MVSGRPAVETAGRSVFQCADTATIALGRGKRLPSVARKDRAGRSCRISIGDPCDTKTVGINVDIESFLAQHLKYNEEGVDHDRYGQVGGTGLGGLGGAGSTGDGTDHAQDG